MEIIKPLKIFSRRSCMWLVENVIASIYYFKIITAMESDRFIIIIFISLSKAAKTLKKNLSGFTTIPYRTSQQ